MRLHRGAGVFLLAAMAGCAEQSDPLSQSDDPQPGESARRAIVIDGTRGPDIERRPGSDRPVVLWRSNERPPLELVQQAARDLAGLSAHGSSVSMVPATTHLLWQNLSTGRRVFWSYSGLTYTGFSDLGFIPTQWVIAGTGDFSGDNIPDLVWQNTSTGARGAWTMNGTTHTGGWQDLGTVPTAWDIAAVADFTGDSRADILWQNTSTGQRGIWQMHGGTVDGWHDWGVISTSWEIAAANDFTGDRKTDIVWQHTGGRRLIWEMNGPVYAGNYFDLGGVATAWNIVAAGDFTGDAKTDLVWHNTSNGITGVWPMNNAVYPGGWHDLGTVHAPWAVASVMEHNPCGDRVTLAIGGTVNGTLNTATDCMRVGNASDYLTFTLTNQIAVRVDLSGNEVDYLTFITRGMESVFGVGRSKNTSGASSTYYLLPAGTYTMTVQTSVAGTNGGYSIAATQVSSDVNVCSPPRLWIVSAPVVTDQQITADDCLEPTSDRRYDEYYVWMVAGRQYTVAAGATRPMLLRIISGTTTVHESFGATGHSVQFTPSSNGYYRIQWYGYQGGVNTLGPYRLTLSY